MTLHSVHSMHSQFYSYVRETKIKSFYFNEPVKG